jgi:hypothetical protein
MRKQDRQPPKTKKYFRSTKSGAGMTKAGVARYRRENPGSKLKTAVTGKVKKGSKAANRRKSYCARSAGQMKKFPKAAADPNSRLRQARRMQLEDVIKKLIRFLKTRLEALSMSVTSGGVDSMEKYRYIIGQINALEATLQELSNLLEDKEQNGKGTVIDIKTKQ